MEHILLEEMIDDQSWKYFPSVMKITILVTVPTGEDSGVCPERAESIFWSCKLWHRLLRYLFTNVSENHAASIFCHEVGGSMLLRNVDNHTCIASSRSTLMFSSHLHLEPPSGILYSDFLTKTVYRLTVPLCMLHILTILPSLTWSYDKYLCKYLKYEACYAVFAVLTLVVLS
jgi:hypothetical protein